MRTLLFLLDRYPAFGGIETVTTILSNQLAEQYRILICSVRGEAGHPLLQQLRSGISFRPLHGKNHAAISEELCAIISEEKVDFVIFQDSYAPLQDIIEEIRHRRPVKLIVAEHSAPGLSRVTMRVQLEQRRWWDVYTLAKIFYCCGRSILSSMRRRSRLYRLCDRYVLLSEKFFPEFRKNSYVRETSKLCAISNPLTYEQQAVDWGCKEKRVLFVGQFVRLKGLDRLLRIWQQIAQEVPEWKLTLVGDGPCMPEVQQFIQQHQLPRVEAVGFSSHVQEYCLSAQVLCMCSSFEGFGMVLTEGMSCGCVPVAFNSFSSLADIISDGCEGFCVPAFDENIYAERLVQLLQDDALRTRMAHAALAKSAQFDRRAISTRWAELLEQTLKA